MSRLENSLKDTVLTQCKFFLPDALKVTGCTISTPKSYDEHLRQVKYGIPPPGDQSMNCSTVRVSPIWIWGGGGGEGQP